MNPDTEEKLRKSIEYNLTIQRISQPPKPREIQHYLGNCLGLLRAEFVSNPEKFTLEDLLLSLQILNQMTGLEVCFDNETHKFTSSNDFEY